MYIQKDTSTNYSNMFKNILTYIYIYIFYHNMNILLCEFDGVAATFGQKDTSEYYAAPELEGSGTLF